MATIDYGEFSNIDCSDIVKGHLTIPKGIKRISSSCFFNASIFNDSSAFTKPVKSIVIPESVTSIGNCAFNYCELTSLIIPKNIKFIEEQAFANNNISIITIKSSEVCIAKSAFANNPIKKINVIINDKKVVLKEKDLLKISNLNPYEPEDGTLDGTLIIELAKLKQILEYSNNAYDKINIDNCAAVLETLEKLEVVGLITKSDISNEFKPKTKKLKRGIRKFSMDFLDLD